MNKKLLYAIGILALVVLGYIALKDNQLQSEDLQPHAGAMPAHGGSLEPKGLEQSSESGLELIEEAAIVPFNKLYPIDEEWNLIVNQFEPDARISDPGVIESESDQENNPAIKVDFYKNGELIHYQIVFKETPGFHAPKQGQVYLLDFMDYSGYVITDDGSFAVETANLKIWRIK